MFWGKGNVSILVRVMFYLAESKGLYTNDGRLPLHFNFRLRLKDTHNREFATSTIAKCTVPSC